MRKKCLKKAQLNEILRQEHEARERLAELIRSAEQEDAKGD